jgi:hypothetical protein
MDRSKSTAEVFRQEPGQVGHSFDGPFGKGSFGGFSA